MVAEHGPVGAGLLAKASLKWMHDLKAIRWQASSYKGRWWK
ncbi:hypothetical protein PGR6_55570 [Pseudomonas sp. GR 6-02]|nr:hypothetical protein PGR6_55570 [Pseudomonas sp. GR 6-02]